MSRLTTFDTITIKQVKGKRAAATLRIKLREHLFAKFSLNSWALIASPVHDIIYVDGVFTEIMELLCHD